MNFFLDTEFYENGKTIELISIALVADDGRWLYYENRKFDWDSVPTNHWIHENVKPHLKGGSHSASKEFIADAIKDFVLEDETEPTFYGYFADYDWVVLCQLFGSMMQLPKRFPKYCRDLKQMMDERGFTSEWKKRICPDPVGEHNALVDAQWNQNLYEQLQKTYAK